MGKRLWNFVDMKQPWELIVIYAKALSTQETAVHILLNSCSIYFEKVSTGKQINS